MVAGFADKTDSGRSAGGAPPADLNIEQATNAWLAGHPILIQPAVYFYRSYNAVLLGVLLWVFVRHPDSYRPVRRTLLAMTALALAVFWALPMTPPRLFPLVIRLAGPPVADQRKPYRANAKRDPTRPRYRSVPLAS